MKYSYLSTGHDLVLNLVPWLKFEVLRFACPSVVCVPWLQEEMVVEGLSCFPHYQMHPHWAIEVKMSTYEVICSSTRCSQHDLGWPFNFVQLRCNPTMWINVTALGIH